MSVANIVRGNNISLLLSVHLYIRIPYLEPTQNVRSLGQEVLRQGLRSLKRVVYH